MISIKKDLIRDPIVIATLTAAITLLFTINVAAFVRGTDAPWLLGS